MDEDDKKKIEVNSEADLGAKILQTLAKTIVPLFKAFKAEGLTTVEAAALTLQTIQAGASQENQPPNPLDGLDL